MCCGSLSMSVLVPLLVVICCRLLVVDRCYVSLVACWCLLSLIGICWMFLFMLCVVVCCLLFVDCCSLLVVCCLLLDVRDL